MKPICDRCGDRDVATIVSWFNTDIICKSCANKEKVHPLYSVAKMAEHMEVVNGNLNYEGIGKPEDL